MKKMVHNFVAPKYRETLFVCFYFMIGLVMGLYLANMVNFLMEWNLKFIYRLVFAVTAGLLFAYVWDITLGNINRVVVSLEGVSVYKDGELIEKYRLTDVLDIKVFPIIDGNIPLSFSKALRVITPNGNIKRLWMGTFNKDQFLQIAEDVNILLKRTGFLEEEFGTNENDNYFPMTIFDIPRKKIINEVTNKLLQKLSTVGIIGIIVMVFILGFFIFAPNATPTILKKSVLIFCIVFIVYLIFATLPTFVTFMKVRKHTPKKVRFNDNGVVVRYNSVDLSNIKNITITSEGALCGKKVTNNYRWMIIEDQSRVIRLCFGLKKFEGSGHVDSFVHYKEVVDCLKKWAAVKEIPYTEEY